MVEELIPHRFVRRPRANARDEIRLGIEHHMGRFDNHRTERVEPAGIESDRPFEPIDLGRPAMHDLQSRVLHRRLRELAQVNAWGAR
jgi:hypothetical protein